MANVLGELFQDIADAIRSKTGSTDKLKPNQFPEAIEGITTGGGGSSADVRYVTFRNESTGEEYKKPVAVGDDCVDVVAKGLWKTPTKESTAQYNYTFYGWGASDGGAADANILNNIRADKTVYAIFTATARLYTITWLDEDGTELPGQKQWAYGTVPSYTPTKEGVAFDKWTPTPTAVTGDASYTAVWTSVVASGTLASGQSWKLYTDGLLSISGSGIMTTYKNNKYQEGNASYPYTNNPLYPYADQITKVEIGYGITAVGGFYAFEALTSVSIPSSVTTIRDYAFASCTALTSITLPNSVTSIGKYAFTMCDALNSINIPSGVKKIDMGAFNSCTAITGITLPTALTSFGDVAFQGCTSLTAVTIPSGVTAIGVACFRNCSLLASVTFENTNGWTAGDTALSETDLADPATAATHLVTTYVSSKWTRS